MATYRVAVTYTVDVLDREALLKAGADAWQASAGGWTVGAEEDGVVDATAEEASVVVPTPEASVALVLGDQGYPSVPGVRFTTMSVDVRPGSPE